ncbi:hypothetical protein [Cellulomonas sp. JZ18]|uniref:hypothetical protein n=1 Tax=Cellulomonas sp. JZ18 TaxID=2654191 RepID=UPI00351AF1D3
MLRKAWARALAVTVALLVWLAVGGVGGMAQGRLAQVQTNDAAAFLPSSAESTRAADASRDLVDSQTLPALVVLAPAAGEASPPSSSRPHATWPRRLPTDGCPAGRGRGRTC